jgi:hypothetical protein
MVFAAQAQAQAKAGACRRSWTTPFSRSSASIVNQVCLAAMRSVKLACHDQAGSLQGPVTTQVHFKERLVNQQGTPIGATGQSMAAALVHVKG